MRYLIDTSALHLLVYDFDDAYGWKRSIVAGQVGMCDITELEFLYSARSASHRATVLDLLARSLPWTAIPEGVYARAREVQQILTEHGEHRSAGPIDLLVAATAELSHLALLHRDQDFETIAKHTSQPTKMLQEPA